jgi:hypothetical protein
MSGGTRFALAAALAGGLAVSSPAQAYEVKHSSAGELVRWRRPNVTWTVDRSLRDVKGGEAAVMAAVEAWTRREGAPTLAAEAPDVVLEPGFDGENTVYFARDGFEPAGVALAVTVLSFDDRTGDVLDADIVLNGKYHFGPVVVANVRSAAQGAAAGPTYDIGRVLAHEMGHALGLSDEPALKDALMYPYVPHSRALAAAPGADDVAGLQALYGGAANPNANASTVGDGSEDGGSTAGGCTGAVIASSGLHAPRVAMWVAAGLVLAALVIARRGGRARRGAAGCTLLASAALVVTPPTPFASVGPNVYDARAVVTKVHTTSVRGVFRSEVELATTACASTACPDVSRAIVWGGTIDGVRQVIGGVQVPVRGEKIGLLLDRAPRSRSLEGVVRTMTRIAE